MSKLSPFFRQTETVATSGDERIWGSGGLIKGVSGRVDAAMDDETALRRLVLQKVQKLPPLPKTISDIYALKKNEEPDTDALLKIIQTDPMIVANLLKISNSVMYGATRQIKTMPDVLKFLGYRTVINAAICSSISAHLKSDLTPYGTDVAGFTANAALRSSIVEKWGDPRFSEIRGNLQFAAFLQEIGVFVVSKIAIERQLGDTLRAAILRNSDHTAAEEAVFGISAASVTSLLFSEWKFNPETIDLIDGADHPERVGKAAIDGAHALKVTKVLAPLGKSGITQESLADAWKKVREYGFDEAAFEKMLSKFEIPS